MKGAKLKKFLNLILLISFFSGCVTMGAMNVPGQTTASMTLKADILGMINMVEKAQAPGCRYKVVDTKVLGVVGDSVNEEWTVDSCGKNIIYPVTLTPDPKGGTYFGITTPKMEDR